MCADAWWHHQGTGMTGHVVRDLPAALGFAAVVAAVAARPPAVLSRAPLRGLGTISYGLYLWHLPVLLWLRFEGLMPGGFVVPWLEVAALSRAGRVRELGARRAARDRGRRAAGARGRGACRASRPSCTSSRCRAWREARDDGVRLVDDVRSCAGPISRTIPAASGAARSDLHAFVTTLRTS